MSKPHVWIMSQNIPLIDCPPVFTIARIHGRQPISKKDGDFYRITCPDWVKIFAKTRDGQLILVEQFRFGSEEISMELPAGIMDHGETPLESARRELLEETGYDSDDFQLIASLRPSPAFQDNFLHIVVARNCTKVAEQHLDQYEEIEVSLASEDEVRKKIADGEINNAVTIAAFFMAVAADTGTSIAEC